MRRQQLLACLISPSTHPKLQIFCMGVTITVLTQHSETLTMELVGLPMFSERSWSGEESKLRSGSTCRGNPTKTMIGMAIFVSYIRLTLLSQQSFRRAWWTLKRVPRVVITSRNQSGPGEDARPTAIAFPSSCCSIPWYKIHHETFPREIRIVVRS